MDYSHLANLLYPHMDKDISYYLKKYPDRKIPKNAQVVRFAPSPTGYLHIGHFFSAYLDFLIAKNSNGIFYFRLEDTDFKRLVDGSDKVALDVLKKYEIDFNEGYLSDGEIGNYGPYQQSKRAEIYHTFAKHLVSTGRAYPCFCGQLDKEEIFAKRESQLEQYNTINEKDVCRNLSIAQIAKNIKENKPFALRFKSLGEPEQKIEFSDIIKGERTLAVNTTDFVLIKNNGMPVYHFAHVVDDFLMKTTIVVRGEEWFSTLPLHIEIFDAFGFKPPQFAHTPVLMKIDEQSGNLRKISKRKDKEADMRYFLNKGYPTDAVKKYILTLLNSNYEPWQIKNPQLSYKDYPFDLNNINNSNPLFDNAKLDDISKNIIGQMTTQQIYENILNWAKEYDTTQYKLLKKYEREYKAVLSIDRETQRPRKDIVCYSDIKTLYDYILPEFKTEQKLNELNALKTSNLKAFLTDYAQIYDTNSTNEQWFEQIKTIAQKHNFADSKQYRQNPDLYAGTVADAVKAVRYAITGKVNTPTLFDIMNILGRTQCIARLNNFIKLQF